MRPHAVKLHATTTASAEREESECVFSLLSSLIFSPLSSLKKEAEKSNNGDISACSASTSQPIVATASAAHVLPLERY